MLLSEKEREVAPSNSKEKLHSMMTKLKFAIKWEVGLEFCLFFSTQSISSVSLFALSAAYYFDKSMVSAL